MSVRIKPEQQIQRINQLQQRLNDFSAISAEELNKRKHEKSWSSLEVMKHMCIGHKAYSDKVNKALTWEAKKGKAEDLKCRTVPNFLIKRFPPRDKKIRMKMKTTSKFKPLINGAGDKDAIITELNDCLEELKGWVNAYRTNQVSLKLFPSALGPIVRFNVPECCEFILGHNERHFLQVDNTLEATKA